MYWNVTLFQLLRNILKLHEVTWNELHWMYSDNIPCCLLKGSRKPYMQARSMFRFIKCYFECIFGPSKSVTRIEPDSPSDLWNESTSMVDFHLTSNCSSMLVFIECVHGLQEYIVNRMKRKGSRGCLFQPVRCYWYFPESGFIEWYSDSEPHSINDKKLIL